MPVLSEGISFELNYVGFYKVAPRIDDLFENGAKLYVTGCQLNMLLIANY